jgi:acetyltransferase-like isoleucine patch superfamily enzyme
VTEVSPEWARAATARSTSCSPLALIAHALREPGVAIREGRAILKGLRCRAWCRLRGLRLKAGRNLRIDGRLILRGPGAVVLGDNVRIGMTVTPWTYAPDAVITIGDDSFVNGTSFACAREIRIGHRAILGRSSIMDTDFHSVRIDRHDPAAPIRVAPVILGDNVWIAAQAGILPGTRIGANSVVGFGAVCAGVFPDNVVIAGNPAKVIKRLGE